MDIIKHLELFDPAVLRDEEVAVIGCGATGSMVALQLAKLGVNKLHIYDFDQVEYHNIPNQMLYGPGDVGQLKTDVLKDKIDNLIGTFLVTKPHERRVEDKKLYHETVFFCVDTMAARKQIFERGIYLNGITTRLIDLRISSRDVLVYSLDPSNLAQVDNYKALLYTDEEVPKDTGKCGVTLSMGPTACLGASLAVWQFVNRVNKKNTEKMHGLSVHIEHDGRWHFDNYQV